MEKHSNISKQEVVTMHTPIIFKDRILWVDWIKFLATVGIIGIHVSSSYLSSDILFSLSWYQGVISSSIFRFAIILFVMASGFLLLRKQQSVDVIPRRFKRIILPFIFWLIIYAIIKVVVKQELGASWNIFDLVTFIFNGFLDPLGVSIQFWYVYMILGLYLLSPAVSRWIKNAPIYEIEYVLIIWLIVSTLQFFKVNFLLLDYLRYFTGAIGYFILGHYLTVKKHILLENKTFGLSLFIIGSLITIIGTIILSYLTKSQSLYFIRLGDITPGACLQGIGLFILIKNIDFSKIKPEINKQVINISKNSYGIYLVNILVVNVFNKLSFKTPLTFLDIFIEIILVLIISYIIIRIMSKIKYLNMFSGTT